MITIPTVYVAGIFANLIIFGGRTPWVFKNELFISLVWPLIMPKFILGALLEKADGKKEDKNGE